MALSCSAAAAKNSSRPGAQHVDHYTRWELPSVDFDDVEQLLEEVESEPAPTPPTAEEIAAWERESREQGYREGYVAGLEKGEREGRELAESAAREQIDAQLASLRGICDALAEPLAALDSEVEDELLQLTVTLAQQLVRREMRSDPGEIIGVIRESLRLLPANARRVRVHLNPEDAALLRESLPGAEREDGWSIVEDPLISRGGCRLSSETSRIDATLEARLAALAANALGGSRGDD